MQNLVAQVISFTDHTAHMMSFLRAEKKLFSSCDGHMTLQLKTAYMSANHGLSSKNIQSKLMLVHNKKQEIYV